MAGSEEDVGELEVDVVDGVPRLPRPGTGRSQFTGTHPDSSVQEPVLRSMRKSQSETQKDEEASIQKALEEVWRLDRLRLGPWRNYESQRGWRRYDDEWDEKWR